MVIMVLLKLAFTWATPAVTMLRSLRRTCWGASASQSSSPPSDGLGCRGHYVLPLAIGLSLGVCSARPPAEKCLATIRGMVARFLFLAGDRASLALAGARVGVRGLPTGRQAPAVAEAAIT